MLPIGDFDPTKGLGAGGPVYPRQTQTPIVCYSNYAGKYHSEDFLTGRNGAKTKRTLLSSEPIKGPCSTVASLYLHKGGVLHFDPPYSTILPISQELFPALVAVLAPLVELVVQLTGEGDVGNNDGVQGAGGIARLLVGVTTGVVLVLALGARLPRHAALGHLDGALIGGSGRRGA